jgi:catechol 2,3-dioxygenase-like lactoylglutathione lyase family enzyme
MAIRFPALRVDHLSIAVEAIAPAFAALARILPLRVQTPTTAGYDADFRWTDFHLGARKLEMIESARPGSFVERFLARRGEAMHHLSLEVEEHRFEPYVAALEADGLRIVDRGDYGGGNRTAFISPRTSPGILVQFWEVPGFRGEPEPPETVVEQGGVRFRVAHLAIGVRSLDAAVEWFGRAFPAEIGASRNGRIDLRLAGYPLALVETDGPEGFHHLAVDVDRLAPLEATVPLERGPLPGVARLALHGFVFELREVPALRG